MATLAQNESKKTSKRVKVGQMISFQNEVFYGTGKIISYDKVVKNLVVNEERAETVRFIYSEYLKGRSIVQISDELTRRECITSTELKRWSAISILRVLRNPFYLVQLLYKILYT